MVTCPECGALLRDDEGREKREAVIVRLVRDARGIVYPWTTTDLPAQTHVTVCVSCLARLPLHDPMATGERGAIWSRPPTTPRGSTVFTKALARLPSGEAIYGWPSHASCYLVPESLVRRLLPKVWEQLQQATVVEREHVEREHGFWRRLLFRLRRRSGESP